MARLEGRGYLMKPLIVKRIEDPDGKVVKEVKPVIVRRVLEPDTVDTLTEMLELVVRDGTGRRAAVPGLQFAMKTGTAGEREPGLNSVIFGFAPLDEPEVAFGFVAEHAGKAELEGARIVRDFLSTVRNEFGQAP